jgi:hypothetical protein
MRSLYFIKPSKPYNAGEVAGFVDKTADRLISLGAAIPIEEHEAEIKAIAESQEEEAPKKPAKRAAKKAAKRSK